MRPGEFYRAYLLGFMCWLGVALGSMAILMIRHLTGGGWGTVIRRILGAAMRTLPLLAVLFIPLIVAVAHAPALHLGEPLESTFRISISASTSRNTVSSRKLPDCDGFIDPRNLLFRHLERALVPAIEVVEANRPPQRARQQRHASRPSAGPGSFSTDSPSPSPPSTGSCRSIPVGSRPSSA